MVSLIKTKEQVMAKRGGIRKIGDVPEKKVCNHPEHNPPMHWSPPPGTYEYVCPSCGNKKTIHIGPAFLVDLRYGAIPSAEAFLEHAKTEAKTYPSDAVIHRYVPILENLVVDLKKAQEYHVISQLLSRATR